MRILITKSQLGVILENTVNETTNWGSNYVVYNNNTFVNYLKSVEGLELEAYDLGDGKITIGYGHAEDKNSSNYKVGDTISKSKAEELLKTDAKEAETKVNDYMSDNFPNKDLSLLQKQMITDFAYNPGLSKFPKFVKAVVTKDWDTAKQEYKRYHNGRELGRNKVFYDTFLSKAISGGDQKTSLWFNEKDFTVYPNPVEPEKEITIKVSKDKLPQDTMTAKIYTVNGRLVDSHSWNNVQKGILQFNAPEDKGVYIILINKTVKIKLWVQ
jgi:GH24 family phage-related lysozyme (muramidase)